MKLGNLKNLDASIEFHHGNLDLALVGITDLSQMLEGHFIFLKNKNYYQEWLLKKSKTIGVVIDVKYFQSLSNEQQGELKNHSSFIATVADVNLAMSFFSKSFYDLKYKNPNDVVDGRQMGTAIIDPTAWIAQGVFVGENVQIGANVKLHSGVVIMSGVCVGENTEIFSNSVIYRNAQIGKHVRIHSNCSIGADGFGYNFHKGEHLKVWQMGSVIIHDQVEIGANSCVDAGTFSPTVIGPGCKFDNQVQIGHNCKLGRGVILCAQAGIAGSTSVGDYTVLGGQAGIANGLSVGKGVQVAAASGVTHNIGDGEVVGGFPARNIKEWMKGIAYLRKLSLGKNN